MKWLIRHWQLPLALVVLTLIAFVGWRIHALMASDEPIAEVKHTESIDTTPEEIRSIRNIRQWEFMAIETEELVEHHEPHTFGDKHLVMIYHGTLRIGIDMDEAPDDWFTPDTTSTTQRERASLKLPDVKLLDENFIDETRTKTFHEEGTFSSQTKLDLFDTAAQAMKARTLTHANLQAARSAAKDHFTTMFQALGYKKVTIEFVTSGPKTPKNP